MDAACCTMVGCQKPVVKQKKLFSRKLKKNPKTSSEKREMVNTLKAIII